MEPYRDTAGAAGTTLYRSQLGLLVHHTCDPSGEVRGVWPELPTLGFVHNGVGELRLVDDTAYADPTQVVLLRGGVPFQIQHHQCAGTVCATTVSLSREGIGKLSRRFGLDEMAFESLLSDRLVIRAPWIQKQLLYLIVDSMAGDGKAVATVDERILGLFSEGISLASSPEGPRGNGSRAARVVQEARLILARNMEKPPCLDELASVLGYSGSHLCRLFKAQTGLTVNGYLHRVRLNAATLELLLGPDDLSSLAFQLGYSSHSHFTSRFRSFYGMSPSVFRDQIRRLASGGQCLPMAILREKWPPKGLSDPRSADSSWTGTPVTTRRSRSSCHW